MMRPRASWFAMSMSYHLRRMMERSLAVLERHAGQAALAAVMAAWASWGPRLATSARSWPVAGSCTAKRLAPVTHWPSTRASVLSRLGSLSWARGLWAWEVGMGAPTVRMEQKTGTYRKWQMP